MAKIQAEKREGIGKGTVRALRREGLLPGVVYGRGKPNLNLTLSAKDFIQLIESEGRALTSSRQDLTVGKGRPEMVLIRDLQTDPMTGAPMHVDFLRMDPNRVIDIDVPVTITGQEESPGIKRGGTLNVVRRRLEVWCKAGEIPADIIIDVSHLDIGDVVHIEEVALPAGVEVRTDVDFTVVGVVGAQAEKAEVEEVEEGEAVEGGEGVEGAAEEGGEESSD